MAIAGLALISLLAAGCGLLRTAAAADDLKTWSPVPLGPDGRLAAEAIKSTVCHPSDTTGPISVVLQDRRTAMSAAFLVEGPDWTGSCLLTLAGGNASGGSSSRSALPAMDTDLVVDERSSGGVGSASASLLGGRSSAGVVEVDVTLPGGTTVKASVSDGHWLAWWPGDALGVRVVALDSGGLVVATITDTTPGYQQK